MRLLHLAMALATTAAGFAPRSRQSEEPKLAGYSPDFTILDDIPPMVGDLRVIDEAGIITPDQVDAMQAFHAYTSKNTPSRAIRRPERPAHPAFIEKPKAMSKRRRRRLKGKGHL